ncbi:MULTISPECIES: hypothetical protein [unclassified Streptomyces]|uniref:hypothetical protein n=1 Tax=unclassified Streptomyces TaxID=2593676 RepID=UPI0036629ABC
MTKIARDLQRWGRGLRKRRSTTRETVQATAPRARIDQDDQAVTFAGAGNEWTFALPVAPLLRLLAGGPPATLADLAAASDLTLVQVAEAVSALVAGQAVVVVGGSS